MPAATNPKFTLRFHNAQNHEILGVLAEHFGVSKNQLAEEMLERELQAVALTVATDLTGTLQLLQSYKAEDHLGEAIAQFAHAEAYVDDPIKTVMVGSSLDEQDVYGIAEAFAS